MLHPFYESNLINGDFDELMSLQFSIYGSGFWDPVKWDKWQTSIVFIIITYF